MKYRKEIDGLRALAVIPVILFHAGFSQFSGGFVGVDVFFVISGYLITTIILSEMENGTFSLVNFYERRARRIIPALFLVLLASALLAWLYLPPTHMEDFLQSLIAVSLFSSNILFWLETGYWGVENELKPLLHTWSLAVEEQYYILFPLFLMAMWRFKTRWIMSTLFIVAIASLLLSQWAAFKLPAANFFLLPTRGWELAVGAGISFYFLYRKNTIRSLLPHKFVDEFMSWLGLVLIAYAVFIFDENTPFPSVYALVPTIGAALIIVFSSKEVFVGKILGSKAFVGVGLISYSAYLWHQPLFAFARHGHLHEPGSVLLILLSTASLLIGFLSWKYIETPFRKKGVFSRKSIFSLTIFGSILFIAFSLIVQATSNYPREIFDAASLAKIETFSNELCENFDGTNESVSDYCILVGNKPRSVFLYGDSHALVLANESKKSFSETDFGLIFTSLSGCAPVRNLYSADIPNKHECYERNNQVYDYIEKSSQIEYVILFARWTLYIEGRFFDNKEGGVEQLGRGFHVDIVENDKFLYHENYSHREEIADAFINSIQGLLDSGKKVVLIYPAPETGWNVPDYVSGFSDPKLAFSTSNASTSYVVFKARNKRAIDALNRVKENRNLIRVFPEKLFCDGEITGRCITQKDGVIFYKDDDHLSNEGARLLLDIIMSKLQISR